MKKVLAMLLTIALMMSLAVTAFAVEHDTTGDKSMTVTYAVAPSYIVTIPGEITIGADETAIDTIKAENVVVNKGQYVSVSLDEENGFTVTTQEGASLTYTVTANGETLAAGDEILAVNPADGKTGTATITFDIDESAIQYAGTYTGSATFTIAVKDVPVTIINFTIDGTSYQAEKGMTWGAWVESAYNVDEFVESDGGIFSYGVVCYGDFDYFMEYGGVSTSDVIEAGHDYSKLSF